MAKDLVFRVEISFSGKVETDEEIQEVTQKIADALESHVNSAGLAPENSDIFTEHIRVTENFLNKTIIVSF